LDVPNFEAPIAKLSRKVVAPSRRAKSSRQVVQACLATNLTVLQSTRRMRRRRDMVGEILAHNANVRQDHADKAPDEHNGSAAEADRG
jgi:hypothetical protein